MQYKINLSVHDLVDTLLRSGDIDSRVFNNATMLEGTRIHQYYQSKMDKDYKSEYYLSHEFMFDEYLIHIEGYADGIIKKDDYVIVDEIKSCVGDLETFHEKNEDWHLGQAKVYAYIYCFNNNVKSANIVLTYISQEDNKITKKYFYEYSFEELKTYFYDLIYEFVSFYNIVRRHKEKINKDLKSLRFPYGEMNLHQDELIDFVEEVENYNGQRAIIEAPTGIGKTISFIYPSLKNIDKYDKIFYLTAKSSGKEVVDNTINEILNKDSDLKSIILTAKEKICPLKQTLCNPEDCFFAKGYYDKCREILKEVYQSKIKLYNYDFFKEIEQKYNICPFEFQLDLATHCDLIIGDYNYIFDPFVSLERFVKNDLSKSLLLIDEGHNLLERVRGMYSATITYESIDETLKSLRHLKEKKLKDNISKIKKYLNELNEEFFINKILKVEYFDEEIIKLLTDFSNNYKNLSEKNYKLITTEYKKLFIEVNKFLKLYELVANEEFAILFFKSEDGKRSLNILTTSPTKYIDEVTSNFKNTLIFSATLTPFNYYNQIFFNSDERVLTKVFDSPFDEEKLNFMISPKLSIKYKDRLSTLNDVISQIVAFVSSKSGNYFVFVPSYEYLNLLKANLILENAQLLYQSKEMKEFERREFIDNFKEFDGNTKVGVCVLGGSFSESINLVGESLIGVIVIGVGMPSISFENNEIKDYYNLIGLDGFYYAYLVPGMKNVTQAVGRLIRTTNDYGSVLLIDQRYGYSNYKKLFRKEWNNYKVIENDYDIIKNLNIFYKKY